VVLVAWVLASVGFVLLFHRLLTAGLDEAASARSDDIAAALQVETPAEIESGLLATDLRVFAVQIIDSGGQVVRSSRDAPAAPMTPSAGVRVSEHSAGAYTVVVATDAAAVGQSVRLVAAVLAGATLLVVPVAAGVNYLMVRRSLRAVEAMRARLAEISAADLDARVPVPLGHDEIQALAVTMNAMLDRIESGQVRQRRFVGDASYALRSPVATILSALETVERQPQLFDGELASTTLLPQAHRMKLLIEDLLLLARADERGLALRRRSVRLDEVLGAEAARVAVVSSALRVEARLAAVSVVGDPEALGRAVRNVCDNAVRHASSVIELSVAVVDGFAVVRVGDDGPGIAVQDRVRVFDRFVRLEGNHADPREHSSGGTGLGLAIVAEIVAGHHGTVGITDRDHGGTVVTIRIPGGRER
jgi:signal transduction histidine kinase